MSRELIIQRMISLLGLALIIFGYTCLISFNNNPIYLTGIGFFFSCMLGVSCIVYREERLDKFINDKEGEQK